jgi:hypothetical protein
MTAKGEKLKRARQDSNLRPLAPEAPAAARFACKSGVSDLAMCADVRRSAGLIVGLWRHRQFTGLEQENVRGVA